MQPAGIALKGLQKSHGSFVAVHGIDIDIEPGEFFSMLGPSGCGKTTTLRMIAGFETPTRGSILLAGEDVTAQPPEKRAVNMVFQSYALFPNMSVFENIAFGLRSKGTAPHDIAARVGEMLDITKLTQLANRRPRQLSGGQQQRVALARALVNRPRALLLDEPLGALDLMIRRHMQSKLKRLQREFGITFVYVTHDQEEALALSDRIAVMRDGRIAQCGTPEEIYSRPVSREVASFIGDMNFFEGTIADNEGQLALRTSDDVVLPLARERLGEKRPGDRATLAIRPENIVLGEFRDHPPGIAGRLTSAMFLGATAKAEIALGPDLHLTALVRDCSVAPMVGSRVSVCWKPEHTYIFD